MVSTNPVRLRSLPPNCLPVPDVRQDTVYSCGPSALQAVFGYYGEETFEADLMRECHTDPNNGTNPRELVRVAREHGFQADMRDNLTLADLEKSIQDGVPVIIEAQAWREDQDTPWKDRWDDGHYMVVIGMDDQNVYFEDPSIFASKGAIPRAEFLDRWHDVDDRPYVHSGIFIHGKPAPPQDWILVE